MPSNNQQPPSREQSEFVDWLQHPCTKLLQENFRERRQVFMEAWAAGKFTDTNNAATAMLNAEAIGGCKILQLVLDIEFEDLYQPKGN